MPPRRLDCQRKMEGRWVGKGVLYTMLLKKAPTEMARVLNALKEIFPGGPKVGRDRRGQHKGQTTKEPIAARRTHK